MGRITEMIAYLNSKGDKANNKFSSYTITPEANRLKWQYQKKLQEVKNANRKKQENIKSTSNLPTAYHIVIAN